MIHSSTQPSKSPRLHLTSAQPHCQRAYLRWSRGQEPGPPWTGVISAADTHTHKCWHWKAPLLNQKSDFPEMTEVPKAWFLEHHWFGSEPWSLPCLNFLACGEGNDNKRKLLPTAQPVITLRVNDLTNFEMLWKLISIYCAFWDERCPNEAELREVAGC